ncbi:response regulator transcription factor [Paenibacillus cymbidii]|uniref:response regulator transcription factor n=1 Tax=Paenibacillus cymbidii TaxID=1639034 RepID=UPI00108074B1|nr:response regulator [Paenibacillus cymbidii]
MTLRVAIVDDEERIRTGLERILAKCPTQQTIVGSYANGMDAMIGSLSPAQGKPDVLITDIEMPVMNGLVLVRELRKKLPQLYVIALSGYSEFEYAREALRLGITDYLLKPVEKVELFRLLETFRKAKDRESGEDGTAKAAAQPESGDNGGVVAKVHQLLDKEYGAPFDLKRLSALVGLSPSYLSHQYSQKTGETITDYLNRLRIGKAKEFLQDYPDLKIYEIARTVGYPDVMYFNKLFKKMTGLTPKEYRGGDSR